METEWPRMKAAPQRKIYCSLITFQSKGMVSGDFGR